MWIFKLLISYNCDEGWASSTATIRIFTIPYVIAASHNSHDVPNRCIESKTQLSLLNGMGRIFSYTRSAGINDHTYDLEVRVGLLSYCNLSNLVKL